MECEVGQGEEAPCLHAPAIRPEKSIVWRIVP
jgi:hypothetical protein